MSTTLIRDLIFRSAANKPQKTAYICGNKSISWAEINQRSNQAVAAFQSLGFQAGDALGIIAPETIEVYEHFFACFKMGAIRTGLNRRFSGAEVMHVVSDAKIKMILVHTDCVPLLNTIKAELIAAGVSLVGYGDDHGLDDDYERLLNQVINAPIFPEIDPQATAMYTYTSGTTGNPKGVVLSDRAIKTVVDGAPGSLGFHPDDLFFCPLANAWAAVVANLLGLSNGMTVVVPDKEYDTVTFLKEVERIGITAFLLAPTMLQWMLDAMDQQSFDVSSIRMALYGSAPATPKLIAEVSSRLGCGMVQAYGVSECSAGWITSLSAADHVRGLSEKPELLQSAGRVPSYFELSIRNDDGIEVPLGDVGEVWVKSDAVMSEYLNLPKQTDEVLKADGWLITNDMGVLDDEGYLYLKDRRKFMIVTGGINVFPAHVEAVMSSHESIAELAVFGVPHVVWGEAVVAVVYCNKGFENTTQEQLLAHCEGKLGKVMMPKYVHFTTESLPKSVNLKVQKHHMQAWFKDDPSLLPDSFTA